MTSCGMTGLAVVVLLLSLSAQSQETIGQSYCQSIAKSVNHGEELLRACEFVVSLPTKLPNVICEETTRRFEVPLGTALVLRDTISATVTHDKTGQQYSDLKVDGKPADVQMPELMGAWSVGEFAGDLRVVFDEPSAAEFKFVKEGALRSSKALIFDFKVSRANNRTWSLEAPTGSTFPGLKGKIWLNIENAQIMRLEIETADIPDEFPIKRLAKEINYADVKLGDGTNFVLPSDSVGTFCSYSIRRCSRNVLTFRNCHKFAAKARIVSGEE